MINGKLVYSGVGNPARLYSGSGGDIIKQTFDDIQFYSVSLNSTGHSSATIEGVDKYGYKFFAEYPSWDFKLANDEQDLNECIGATEATLNDVNLSDIDGVETVKYNKYLHEIKPGIFIDVYDVLMAWNVTNPALQHLIKKALQAGERGHKSREQDLQDIIDSAIRAKELEIK